MAALLFVIMAVTNLGRLNVSVAGKYIQDEFLLSTRTMGWILSAFASGMRLFKFPVVGQAIILARARLSQPQWFGGRV